MSGASRSASHSEVRATRRAVCVLWHPAHEIVDGRLLDALNRKDLSVECCTDAAGALAALLRHGRLAITRSEQPPPLILLLYNPEALPAGAALVRTLNRYAPQAICWVCTPSDDLLLRALSPADLHAELSRGPTAEPGVRDAESSPTRERTPRRRGGQPEQPKRTGAVCPTPRSTHVAGGRVGLNTPSQSESIASRGSAGSQGIERESGEVSAKSAFRTPGQRPRTSNAIVGRATSEVSGPELAMLQDAGVRLGNLAQRDQ
jgi:hypothetical protein